MNFANGITIKEMKKRLRLSPRDTMVGQAIEFLDIKPLGSVPRNEVSVAYVYSKDDLPQIIERVHWIQNKRKEIAARVDANSNLRDRK